MNSNLADLHAVFKWPTYRLHYATLVPHRSAVVGPRSEILDKYIWSLVTVNTIIYYIKYNEVRYRD
jgi:hypothetical protein